MNQEKPKSYRGTQAMIRALNQMGFKVRITHFRVHSLNGKLFPFNHHTKKINVATDDELPVYRKIKTVRGVKNRCFIRARGGLTQAEVFPFTVEEMEKNGNLKSGETPDVYQRYGLDPVKNRDVLVFNETAECSNKDFYDRSIGTSLALSKIFTKVKAIARTRHLRR